MHIIQSHSISSYVQDTGISMMTEAASISESLVNFYQTKRHNNPEGSHLQDDVLLLT
jgi:hypothetical protein